MKTIELTLYKFNELSDDAKQFAADKFNESEDFQYIYDEAENTVKEFCELFNVRTGRNSWLEFSALNLDYEDEILTFTPQRLKTYILNNFGHKLYAPKYRGHLKCNTPVKHNRIKSTTHKNGNVSNCYYSAITTMGKNCNLTGVCYDEDILEPIYKFLEGTKYQQYDFKDLMNFCFQNLKQAIDKEVEYRQSFEAVAEELEANDYDFLANGSRY